MRASDLQNLPDITSWEHLKTTSIPGTREKIMLRSPLDQKRYFIKFPKDRPLDDPDTPVLQEQEIITEYIATLLAKQVLGYEVHTCAPALYNGRLGINNCMLVQDPSSSQLVYPKQLIREDLSQINQELPGEKDYIPYLRLHTLDNVLTLFQQYCSPFSGFFEEKFIPGFLKMVLYDALVGMGDRHWENYGTLKTIFLTGNDTPEEVLNKIRKDPSLFRYVLKLFSTERLRDIQNEVSIEISEIDFAPLFDNSACLYWNLIDKKLPKTTEAIIKYANSPKAWSHISQPGKEKITLFDLLRYILFGMERTIAKVDLRNSLIEEFAILSSRYKTENIRKTISGNHFGLFSDERIELICRYIDVRMSLIEQIFNEV